MNSKEKKYFDEYLMHKQKAEDFYSNKDKVNALTHFNAAYVSLLKSARECENPNVKRQRVEDSDKIQELIKQLEVSFKSEQKSNQETTKVNETKTKVNSSVTFNDVVGLSHVKEALNTRVILPRKHKELFEAFDKKQGGGVLLYGPPGTGKTMIVKALANEMNATFYSVRCSDLLSKYFGESEEKIRSLFNEARSQELSVIFFDEFDAIAAKRKEDSNEVTKRVVSELLSNIDGFDTNNENLLLVAATNLPWNIDEALLRPPRFNDLLYIPLPDIDARKFLFELRFKKIEHKEELDYTKFGELTEGFSGADIEEICDKSKVLPLNRSIANNNIDCLTTKDVLDTIKDAKPSVSKDTINKYLKYNESKN